MVSCGLFAEKKEDQDGLLLLRSRSRNKERKKQPTSISRRPQVKKISIYINIINWEVEPQVDIYVREGFVRKVIRDESRN